MMLDSSKRKRDDAMKYLEKIGDRWKEELLTEKQHKLLDKF